MSPRTSAPAQQESPASSTAGTDAPAPSRKRGGWRPRRWARSRRRREAAAGQGPGRLARLRAGIAGFTRRRVAPVLDVVSPVGWGVLTGAVGCWIVGLLLHVTELTVIAAMLTIPLIIAAAFILGRANYEVTLDLTSHRVVVGERAVGEVSVRNPTQRPILPSRIELAVGSATAQFSVPRLAPDAQHDELFAIPTRRRAVLSVGPVRSVRDDPLSLMRRQVTWAKAEDVFVHPRTVRLDEAASGYLRDLEGTPSSDLSSSDIAFHALRDYTPGDDLRHVHWRTTARTGKLMVRQFEETRRSHVVVALDTVADRYEDDQEFELAVSAAASLSAQTVREEKELTAFTHDERQRTTHFRHLMDDYTLVAPARGRPRLHELGQRASDLAPNASAVMLVVGSQTTAKELNAAATQLPIGIVAVGVRCEIDQDVRRSRIGDLELVTLGALDDLPKAMRAVGR